MEEQAAKILIDKYLSGQANEAEKAAVETWFNQLATKSEGEAISDFDSVNERIMAGLPAGSILQPKKVKLWPRYAAAAVILISFGFGYYFYSNSTATPNQELVTTQDIAPAGNKAILTLANGQQISLTDASNGAIAEEAGIKITKTADGLIQYVISNEGTEERSTIEKSNTISTPNGGKYQVILPDGTKVWLNSASSLKYASNLGSGKERVVELTGEGYFEVAKKQKAENGKQKAERVPFIVKTISPLGDGRGQEVEVLGTHFNINAYPNERAVVTTLLEGSVKVESLKLKAQSLLKPEQQSVLTQNDLKVQQADVETTMAWKNNLFLFYHVDLKTIMRQLERWYDVEVAMETIPDKEFYGEIPRDVKLSEVLTMLEQTSKLKFKVEGRRIMLQN